MFFKRAKAKIPSYSELISDLRGKGFETAAQSGGTLVHRNGYAALLKEGAGGTAEIVESGLLVQGELAVLTDMGFQKIFHSASGRKLPALAEHLRGLHDFVEDVREVLGLTSLYNQGLGTTNEKHLYDRVTLRDRAAQPKPWLKN